MESIQEYVEVHVGADAPCEIEIVNASGDHPQAGDPGENEIWSGDCPQAGDPCVNEIENAFANGVGPQAGEIRRAHASQAGTNPKAVPQAGALASAWH